MRRASVLVCALAVVGLLSCPLALAQQVKPGEEMPMTPVEKTTQGASSKTAKTAKKKSAQRKPAAKVKTVRKDPASYATTGTVRLSMAQGSFILSASGGEGVLTYRKVDYPFRIGGGGIGGFGFARSEAVGTVENLRNIEDFAGVYGQARAGFAAGKGKSALILENTNGVVMKLKATTKGLALSLGGDGLVVEMGQKKQ